MLGASDTVKQGQAAEPMVVTAMTATRLSART